MDIDEKFFISFQKLNSEFFCCKEIFWNRYFFIGGHKIFLIEIFCVSKKIYFFKIFFIFFENLLKLSPGWATAMGYGFRGTPLSCQPPNQKFFLRGTKKIFHQGFPTWTPKGTPSYILTVYTCARVSTPLDDSSDPLLNVRVGTSCNKPYHCRFRFPATRAKRNAAWGSKCCQPILVVNQGFCFIPISQNR